jgi:acetyl esterase/lipase
VLLYFHGGGYNGSCLPAHFQYLREHCERLNGHGPNPSSRPRSYAVLVLSYDVAPYATYPRQLAQAAALLNHVLGKLKRDPANIFLSGDSAGANLTVALLEHLMHPHPDRSVPEVRLPEGRKLGAALLISPWIEMSPHAPSYRRNAWKDIIPGGALTRWQDNFLGGAPRDPYNSMLTAPRGWWAPLSGVVERLYSVSAADEVLIDDILKWQDNVKQEWEGRKEDLVYETVEGEPHDGILTERMLGVKAEDIKSDKVYVSWLEECVPV